MPNCYCNNPPAHTIDDHTAIQARAAAPDPTCLCGAGPSHTTAEHDAIAASQPVDLILTDMKCSSNILFAAQTWGPKVYPSPAYSPFIRYWDTGTGRLTTATQQNWLKAIIASVQSRGPFKGHLQLGQHNLPGGFPDADLRTAAHFIVSLGASKIASVEIYNEPDNQAQATSVDQMGHMASVLRPILQPAGILLGGPSSQGHNPNNFYVPFADKYHALVDFFSHHCYSNVASIDAIRGQTYVYNEYLTLTKALVAKGKQYGKPVWLTEWNIGSFYGHFTTANSVQGTDAATFIRSALRGMRDGGLAQSFFWQWDGSDMPVVLLNSSRTAVTTAGQAWLNAAAALVQGTL